MERICEYQLKIMSASTAAKPLPIPHEIAVIARDGGVGGPHAGFMGFLPHYLEIEAEQPDFLD